MREQTEDLIAFEKRLTECVGYMENKSTKWRVIMVVSVIFVLFSVWKAWRDETRYDTVVDYFWAHKALSVSIAILFLLCLFGGFQKSRGAKVVTQRCRNVLRNYNMSCDEQGKLILKRPTR